MSDEELVGWEKRWSTRSIAFLDDNVYSHGPETEGDWELLPAPTAPQREGASLPQELEKSWGTPSIFVEFEANEARSAGASDELDKMVRLFHTPEFQEHKYWVLVDWTSPKP